MHRLYIFSGKGGTGKTTLSMALTHHLKAQGKEVLYNPFDAAPIQDWIDELDLPLWHQDLIGSAEKYVGKKLGSELVASWVLKTPFFKALFNILPALGHMILLGHIINKLEENPNLAIVLDSPSSGHALSMINSTETFQRVFQLGPIVDDINRMKGFLFDEKKVKVFIVGLASKLAIEEALDLEKEVQQVGLKDTELILNNLWSKNSDLMAAPEALVKFVSDKIEIERQLLDSYAQFKKYIPHAVDDKSSGVIRKLSPQMEELL